MFKLILDAIERPWTCFISIYVWSKNSIRAVSRIIHGEFPQFRQLFLPYYVTIVVGTPWYTKIQKQNWKANYNNYYTLLFWFDSYIHYVKWSISCLKTLLHRFLRNKRIILFNILMLYRYCNWLLLFTNKIVKR